MVEKLFMITGTLSLMVIAFTLLTILVVLLAACLALGWTGMAMIDAIESGLRLTPVPF